MCKHLVKDMISSCTLVKFVGLEIVPPSTPRTTAQVTGPRLRIDICDVIEIIRSVVRAWRFSLAV